MPTRTPEVEAMLPGCHGNAANARDGEEDGGSGVNLIIILFCFTSLFLTTDTLQWNCPNIIHKSHV